MYDRHLFMGWRERLLVMYVAQKWQINNFKEKKGIKAAVFRGICICVLNKK